MNPQNKYSPLEPECQSRLEELYNELIEFHNLQDAISDFPNWLGGYPNFLTSHNSLSENSRRKIFEAYASQMKETLSKLSTERIENIISIIYELSKKLKGDS